MKASWPGVVVDNREQKPYHFPQFEVKTLATGDYSIVGLEDRIAIERKSGPDAYASLGKGRARFERELERLAQFDYAAIVIESSLKGFLQPPAFSRLYPKAAVNSLIAWSIKYGVHVFFADDRRHANALTCQLLEKFYRYHQEKTDAKSE